MKSFVPGEFEPASTLPALLAAFHLASPALPVGGFAYSQGLERAIEEALVRDAHSALQWIADALMLVQARVDAPLWLRAFDAQRCEDRAALLRLNAELLALRETAELRSEAEQMGASLLRLFAPLGLPASALASERAVSFTCAYASACAAMGIERGAGLAAYLWAWVENQVLVAIKSIPLGQQDGQAMLVALRDRVLGAVETARSLGDDEIGSGAIGYALVSVRHETQYSRLYRS